MVGYPCAVGIAAPLAVVRGAGEAADLGIIMRTGEAFQTFREVRRIVLDKTGTLTKGRPMVQEVAPIAEELSEEDLLTMAASAEGPSQHPLARAIVEAAKQLLWNPTDSDRSPASESRLASARAGCWSAGQSFSSTGDSRTSGSRWSNGYRKQVGRWLS